MAGRGGNPLLSAGDAVGVPPRSPVPAAVTRRDQQGARRREGRGRGGGVTRVKGGRGRGGMAAGRGGRCPGHGGVALRAGAAGARGLGAACLRRCLPLCRLARRAAAALMALAGPLLFRVG